MKQIRHRTGAVTEMEQTTAKKNKYEIDMCNGTIMDKLISFSLPLMLSGILQLMFNAVDIIVVGRFSGSPGAGGGGIDQCAHQRVHESVYRNFAGGKCTDGAFLCGGA